MKAGSRSNIIPDAAEATLNVRFRKPEQLEQVVAKVKADAAKTMIPDTKVTVTVEGSFPPLVENAKIDALAARADAIYAELGKKIGHGGNGGASDWRWRSWWARRRWTVWGWWAGTSTPTMSGSTRHPDAQILPVHASFDGNGANPPTK